MERTGDSRSRIGRLSHGQSRPSNTPRRDGRNRRRCPAPVPLWRSALTTKTERAQRFNLIFVPFVSLLFSLPLYAATRSFSVIVLSVLLATPALYLLRAATPRIPSPTKR